MNKTLALLAAACAVTVASLVVAFHEYQDAMAARAELARARHDFWISHGKGGSDLASGGGRRDEAAGRARVRSGEAAPAGAAPEAAPPRTILDSPRIQRLMAAEARGRLDLQYAALFKKLNLTPQQVDQFKNLIVEKQNVALDSINVARQQGIDPATDPRGFYQAVASAESTVDTQIASLIGPDGLNQFQQYLQDIPARNTANLLQQSLSYGSAPLTDAQAAQVTQILTQSNPPWPQPNYPFATLNADLGLTRLNDQATAQLQSVLSPAQLESLATVVESQQQILQARRRAAR